MAWDIGNSGAFCLHKVVTVQEMKKRKRVPLAGGCSLLTQDNEHHDYTVDGD